MQSKAGMKFECIFEEPLDFIDIDYTHLNQTIRYEQRPHGEWIKEPIYLCHYGCDGCYKYKKYADLEWCSTCEFWKADDFRYRCSNCNNKEEYQPRFCPRCGSDNRKSGDQG